MTDAKRDRNRRAALVGVATLTVMSTMAIAPSLPPMARAFAGTPHAELLAKLTLTIPAIVIAICAPLAGWVIDRYGRLPMLYTSMVLYGAAGAAGYFLESLYGILASRILLGFAIAGAMTTTQTLAGDYFHGEARSLLDQERGLGTRAGLGDERLGARQARLDGGPRRHAVESA